MFTGIIEDIGIIRFNSRDVLKVSTALDEIKAGDSVSVNGICLTASEIKVLSNKSSIITFDYTPQTVKETTIGSMKKGHKVNLERALTPNSRLGGHFLTGHVDVSVRILKKQKLKNSIEFTFSYPKIFAKYITEKGSIGVDGISLTVAKLNRNDFKASVIPHTLLKTALKYKAQSGTVNLEFDMLAKYVSKNDEDKSKSKITESFLKNNGFY